MKHLQGKIDISSKIYATSLSTVSAEYRFLIISEVTSHIIVIKKKFFLNFDFLFSELGKNCLFDVD